MNKTLLTSFLLFSMQSLAQSFEPGLWTSKESVSMAGISFPSSSDEECISAAQAKDAKATIEKELKKKGCSLTAWTLKNEKLDAAIKCKNKDMDATGSLSGTFARKSYNLTGKAKGTYKDFIPAVANLKLTGQWTKKCTKK